MIFVFPAVVSKNVDEMKVPALCKSLELYFVYHIAESLQSNTLRVKSIWNVKGEYYGPIHLESFIELKDMTVLTEQGELEERLARYRSELEELDTDFMQKQKDEHRFTVRISSLEDDIRTESDAGRSTWRLEADLEDYQRRLENVRNEMKDLDKQIKYLRGMIRSEEEIALKKSAAERETEKAGKEAKKSDKERFEKEEENN